MKTFSIIVAALVLWSGVATAVIITTTVDGTNGPWNWASGGLNTSYQYGSGFTAPTVVSAANGLGFSAGDDLTISYVSGQVDSTYGEGFWDANGNPNAPFLDDGNWAWVGPSYYMNHATYPVGRGKLVGVFANSSGQLVGAPFAIGNLGTFTVPSGATRLQLGVNDTLYSDNRGSWTIQVTGIPEPTTSALALIGLLGSGLMIRRSQRNAVR
jgi:hypothetical protein